MNILVAEDNLDILNSLETGLSEEGYKVDAVSTGLKRSYKLENWSYELAVLDIMLPEFCGLSVLQQYRRKGGKNRFYCSLPRAAWTTSSRASNTAPTTIWSNPSSSMNSVRASTH